MVSMMNKLMKGEKDKMAVKQIEPDGTVCTDDEEENIIVNVELPGVKAEDIDLRIYDYGFYLKAKKDHIEYVDSHHFGCQVNPNHASVGFQDGVLKIIIPIEAGLPGETKINIES
jgi:HSP20 family molecular chaperone IbpA